MGEHRLGSVCSRFQWRQHGSNRCHFGPGFFGLSRDHNGDIDKEQGTDWVLTKDEWESFTKM